MYGIDVLRTRQWVPPAATIAAGSVTWLIGRMRVRHARWYCTGTGGCGSLGAHELLRIYCASGKPILLEYSLVREQTDIVQPGTIVSARR